MLARRDANRTVDSICFCLRVAAFVLPVFPVDRRGRAAHYRSQPSFPKVWWHNWTDGQDGRPARCTTCFQYLAPRRPAEGHDGPMLERPLTGCTGPPAPLKGVKHHHGHNIQLKDVVINGANLKPIFFCIKCGAYAVT